jgi:asparagine synthetase B (glutamine-hydrolysing)
VGRRDPLGLRTLYYRRGSRGFARTIAELLEGGASPRALSPRGVAGYLDRAPLEGETCFEGIAAVPAGHALLDDGESYEVEPVELPEPPAGSLLDILADGVRQAAEEHGRVALALSGGFDSALVLGLVERLGAGNVVAYSVAADLEGYTEREATLATARFFGREVRLVEAGEEDFIAALPAAVRAMETPLYNLHPLSKYLLASRLRSDGIPVVLTGDGADQVFSGVGAANYIPLIGSLFASQGIEVRSPFLSAATVSYRRRYLRPDPDKRVLRDLGRGLVPSGLVDAEKRRTLTPPLDLSRYWDPGLFGTLSRALGYPLPASFDRDADRVKWVTLSLLYRALVEGESRDRDD